MVEPALEDLVELVERQVDAVIRDAPLRVVVGADALRAVARADEQLALLGLFRLLLGDLCIQQARLQQ